MADTTPSKTFVDFNTPAVAASWLNAVDRIMFDLLGGPESLAELRQSLGGVLQDFDTLGVSTADGEFLVATGAGTLAWESGATARQSLGGVLQDLDTLGVAASDGEFIVATGAGAFAYESGATARTSLGLAIGTNVQAWDAQLDDIAALAVTDGNIIVGDGTNWVAESGATARTSLGLAIGTNVQAWDAQLDDIAGLAVTDSNFIVGNGSNWIVESGATVRTSLGLAIGTNVQAWDAQLDDIAALAVTDSNFIVGNGSNWVAESGATARASLGLTIGTNVQAWDADLDAIAALVSAADKVPYSTAAQTWALATLTAFARSILDDADEAAFKATVNLEIGTDVQAWDNDLDDLAALTPTKGDLITTAGTDWADLAVGSNGQVLTADSNESLGIKWAAAGTPGNDSIDKEQLVAGYANDWVFIETQTASTSATIEFDLPSGFSAYKVIIRGMTVQTNDTSLKLRFSDDDGETFEGDAGDYKYSGSGMESGGSSRVGNSNSATQIALDRAATGINIGSASDESYNGEFFIYNAASASLHTSIVGKAMYHTSAATPVIITWDFAGSTAGTAAANDAIQLFMSSDAILAGQFVLYGLRTDQT